MNKLQDLWFKYEAYLLLFVTFCLGGAVGYLLPHLTQVQEVVVHATPQPPVCKYNGQTLGAGWTVSGPGWDYYVAQDGCELTYTEPTATATATATVPPAPTVTPTPKATPTSEVLLVIVTSGAVAHSQPDYLSDSVRSYPVCEVLVVKGPESGWYQLVDVAPEQWVPEWAVKPFEEDCEPIALEDLESGVKYRFFNSLHPAEPIEYYKQDGTLEDGYGSGVELTFSRLDGGRIYFTDPSGQEFWMSSDAVWFALPADQNN